MSWLKTTFMGFCVFSLQYSLSDYLIIRDIKPDFLIIFVMYVGLKYGSSSGVIAGFTIGLLEDLAGVGSLFGLAPLVKSTVGFFMGMLKGKYSSLNPITFHFIWVIIFFLNGFIYSYIRFQTVYGSEPFLFFRLWLFSSVYTLVFLGIVQFMLPFHKIKDTHY